MYSPKTIIGVRRETVLLLSLIMVAVIAGLIGLLVNEKARIAFLAIILGWLEP